MLDPQMKRGLLEICILAALSRRDSYGYEMIRILSVRAVSGDIAVYLPADSPCRIRHKSLGGDTSIQGLRMDVASAPEFIIQAVSGDVKVRGQ